MINARPGKPCIILKKTSYDLYASMQVELPSHSHVTGDVTQTIYIFCCTQEGCAARADSWRAFKQISPQPGSLTEGAQGIQSHQPVLR